MYCSVCGSKMERIGGVPVNPRVVGFVHFNPWQRVYVNKDYVDVADLGAVIHDLTKAAEYGLVAYRVDP